jgi:hypothetical protein
MTNTIKPARLPGYATFAAALLLSLAVPQAVNAEDAAHRSDTYAQTSDEPAADPTRVGSVAVHIPTIITGVPITTEDIDVSRCGPGQLVRDFGSGNLSCEWTVAE